MKRIVLLALTATLALSGCSAAEPKAAEPTKSANPALSVAWEQSQPVKASLIDNALFDNDVCQSEPSVNDGAYANDTLTMYNEDTFRQCSNFHDYLTDGATMDCPITAYISTGDAAGTDVKHALSYEDGWSLAILYGKGWEISLDPASDMSGDETELDIIKKCSATVENYTTLIGGGIVRYGDYKN
jgi:hypothetical protein